MSTEDDSAQDKPAAAACIADQKDQIIDAWTDRACARLEGAEDVEGPALVDDVPDIIDLLVDAIGAGDASSAQHYHPVRAHGEQRASMTRVDIEWVLEEIRLLRDVVIDHVEERLGRLERAELLLIFEVFEDISDVSAAAYLDWQVRREEKAKERAESSVERLRELTATLEEERELRELFVTAVAHDLRTPLATLQIASELLENFPENEEMRARALEKLQRNIRRLDTMAQRLLDVNRITAGNRLPLMVEQLDLGEVIREYLADARTTHADDSGAEADIVLEMPDVEPYRIVGWWNREALTRILSNLVENGLKYGDPPVTVRVEPREDEVLVQVHNEGEPIAPEEQERIFERFVRLGNAQQVNQIGRGIGLTLVRGLAYALGGRLELDSSEGEGTTFTVRLPWDARPYQED